MLQRQTVTEEPMPPEERMGLCLYRLARGDHYYTIAEMVGRGVATVSSIVMEVWHVLVEYLWPERISSNMLKSREDFERKILDMEEWWQFPCCWVALDGCNIAIKCNLWLHRIIINYYFPVTYQRSGEGVSAQWVMGFEFEIRGR